METKSWLAMLWFFTKGCRWRVYGAIVLAMFSVAGELIPYLGVYQLLKLFFEFRASLDSVLFWISVCLAGHIGQVFFYAASTMLAHMSAYGVLEEIRLEIASKLVRAPLGTVIAQPVGTMKNVLVDRVENIEIPLAHLLPEGVANVFFVSVVVCYLWFLDWRIALSAVATVPLAACIYSIMMRSFHENYKNYTEANNRVNSVIVEYLEGMEVVKAFNQGSSSYSKFEEAVQLFKVFTLNWFRCTWIGMSLGGAILPSTLLVTLPMGLFLCAQGSLSLADLSMSLLLALSLASPMTQFTVFMNDIQTLKYAVCDASQYLRLPETSFAQEPVVLADHSLVFEKVSFAYEPPIGIRPGSLDVLKEVSVTIPEGSVTALVGPSGSGKSTVAKLAARFWDVRSGCIRLGGVDLRRIPQKQAVELVSFVFQDSFLFAGTLRDNIRMGAVNASEDEVKAAAQAACCEGFISELPLGYDTCAGEAGRRLSGGEKQRIAIARAILKNAPILVLDEATAFADPESEADIQKALSVLKKGKTLLIIAHRLSTICKAQQIVVLDQGCVVAAGKHEELLETCHLYRNMWKVDRDARKGAFSTWQRG